MTGRIGLLRGRPCLLKVTGPDFLSAAPFYRMMASHGFRLTGDCPATLKLPVGYCV